jgi:hypothetical protein
MDRFDLEEKINQTHNFVDTINDINYGILEVGMTNDEIVNALEGLAVMLKLHTTKLFDTFAQVHKLDGYNPAEFPG